MRSTLSLILIGLLAVVASIAVALGLGWLLTLILPFSLFEGALLVAMAFVVVSVWANALIRSSFPAASDFPFDDDEWELEDEPILGEAHFWQRPEEKTWTNWLRMIVANTVYKNMVSSEGWIGEMAEPRQEQIAMELTDGAIQTIKSQARRGRDMRVSRTSLRNALREAGQKPYDDALLDMVVHSINGQLFALTPLLNRIEREKSWDDPVDPQMFGL
ncbi:MAG: hypothetical protein KDD73_11125 [Anaerolineales bacterium]|nr:hypothetical protein [Anaerolineales bacterium]MCB9126924.1 hypothetical protein [Ardenticatenales bacterium]